MDSEKPNIGIIANAVSDEGKNVYLAKFLNVIKPLSNEIFVINGTFPESSDKTIHIIKIKADSRQESMFARSIKLILTQLRFSLSLINISPRINITIFFGPTMAMPMFFSKILRKKSILIAGGSSWISTDVIYREKLFGLGGLIFPTVLRTLEYISLSLSNTIIVYSEHIIPFLKLQKYKNKIFIISNIYLDTDKYKIITRYEDRRNLIGFISRLNDGKGIKNFVNAIPLILSERDNLKFLIGGDGPLLDEIKNELMAKALYDKVDLVGWIPHDEIPKVLNELKLLVFPSYSEGMPNIVSEAMACGTPVLATPVGGVPDLIKDAKTGFILKNNSPECIAKNVIVALSNPSLGNISTNAHKLICEKYTYEAAAEKYDKVLSILETNNNV